MSNYVKLVNEATDTYFAALTETQDNFLKAIAAFPAWVHAPPPPTPPGFGELPTMQETIDAGFSFGQKFLKTQQDFTEKLIATITHPAAANTSARNTPAKAKSAVAN